MRAFLILPLSASLLGGCLTSQENPNYEISSQYQGDLEARHQYANAAPIASTVTTYEAAPVEAVTVQASTVEMATAPTDSLYGVRDVSGTPGFMAMESERQAVAIETAAQATPAAEIVTSAPLGTAGTPIAYDYTRNMVSIDAVTTGQQVPDTVRILPGAGKNYTVQQGDTVYSLSRKTCVGVNVIQSMNGLSADYAIKIGQSLNLPTSVC